MIQNTVIFWDLGPTCIVQNELPLGLSWSRTKFPDTHQEW